MRTCHRLAHCAVLLVAVAATVPARADDRVTPDVGVKTSPTVLVVDLGRVVTVYQTTLNGAPRVAYSINGGPEMLVPLPTGFQFTESSQPSASNDEDGNVLIAYRASGLSGSCLGAAQLKRSDTSISKNALVAQRTTANAQTFGNPAIGAKVPGGLVVIAAELQLAGRDGPGIISVQSHDGGDTWPSTVIPVSLHLDHTLGPRVALGDMTAYIGYTDYSSGSDQFTVATAANGGDLFANHAVGTYARDTRYGLPRVDVCAYDQNAWATTIDASGGGQPKRRVWQSVNGGGSWAEVWPTTSAAPQAFSVLRCFETGVSLGYFERAGQGPLHDIKVTTTPDGVAWTDPVRVNDVSIDPGRLILPPPQVTAPLALGVQPNFSLGGRAVVPGTSVFPVWVGGDSAAGLDLFTAGTPPGNLLVAAVLPGSRSVMFPGPPATAFVTIINAGAATAIGVGIALLTGIPAALTYQTTDAANAPTGSPNTPVDIPAGASQTFVVAIAPTAPFPPSDVGLSFPGANAVPVRTLIGLNTLLASASSIPVPDVVALAATPSNNGIVDLAGAAGAGAFAVATVNVGAAGAVTVSADTAGVGLPVSLNVCETNPVTGACLAPPGPSVGRQIGANETPTFGVFVSASAIVPFDPATNRVQVSFTDPGGAVRGRTSVAVRSVGP